MTRIKYDADLMKLIALFESMTGARLKDCIVNEKITFIVGESEMGKAIGKNGANVRRIEEALKKKIRLVEFSSDVSQFVRNLLHPFDVMIESKDGVITINGKDTGTRAMIIGRERQNLAHISDIVKRHFSIREVKVV